MRLTTLNRYLIENFRPERDFDSVLSLIVSLEPGERTLRSHVVVQPFWPKLKQRTSIQCLLNRPLWPSVQRWQAFTAPFHHLDKRSPFGRSAPGGTTQTPDIRNAYCSRTRLTAIGENALNSVRTRRRWSRFSFATGRRSWEAD